jgi:hypothetical protein
MKTDIGDETFELLEGMFTTCAPRPPARIQLSEGREAVVVPSGTWDTTKTTVQIGDMTLTWWDVYKLAEEFGFDEPDYRD